MKRVLSLVMVAVLALSVVGCHCTSKGSCCGTCKKEKVAKCCGTCDKSKEAKKCCGTCQKKACTKCPEGQCKCEK